VCCTHIGASCWLSPSTADNGRCRHPKSWPCQRLFRPSRRTCRKLLNNAPDNYSKSVQASLCFLIKERIYKERRTSSQFPIHSQTSWAANYWKINPDQCQQRGEMNLYWKALHNIGGHLLIVSPHPTKGTFWFEYLKTTCYRGRPILTKALCVPPLTPSSDSSMNDETRQTKRFTCTTNTLILPFMVVSTVYSLTHSVVNVWAI
jgi:hypothetical protein